MRLPRKGDRVEISGEGRTARWGTGLQGTVSFRRGESVFVRWDDTKFTEDQMFLSEVRLLEKRGQKILVRGVNPR